MLSRSVMVEVVAFLLLPALAFCEHPASCEHPAQVHQLPCSSPSPKAPKTSINSARAPLQQRLLQAKKVIFRNCRSSCKALHHRKNSRRERLNPVIANPLKMNESRKNKKTSVQEKFRWRITSYNVRGYRTGKAVLRIEIAKIYVRMALSVSDCHTINTRTFFCCLQNYLPAKARNVTHKSTPALLTNTSQ